MPHDSMKNARRVSRRAFAVERAGAADHGRDPAGVRVEVARAAGHSEPLRWPRVDVLKRQRGAYRLAQAPTASVSGGARTSRACSPVDGKRWAQGLQGSASMRRRETPLPILMAILGHKTLAEAERYTRGGSRAARGQRDPHGGTQREQSCPNRLRRGWGKREKTRS
jgi:hypothetical protein